MSSSVCFLAVAFSVGAYIWRRFSECIETERDSAAPETAEDDINAREVARLQDLHGTIIANLSTNQCCQNLLLRVDRKNCLKESVNEMNKRLLPRLYKLSVSFKGEEGIDCGGLTKEWFSLIASTMTNSQYALFRPSDTDSLVVEPNTFSRRKIQHSLFFLPSWLRQPKHLTYYTFYGRVFGLALCTRSNIHVTLKRSFYEQLLGNSVTDDELMEENPQLFGNIRWLRDQSIDPLSLGLTFSVTERDEETAQVYTVDLIRNGRNLEVTDANKEKYITAMINYKLKTNMTPIMDAFKSGFYEVIPLAVLSALQVTASDLKKMICGSDRINLQEWRKHAIIDTRHMPPLSFNISSLISFFSTGSSPGSGSSTQNNYSSVEQQREEPSVNNSFFNGANCVSWFWKAVGSMSESDRLLLLRFVTGSDCLPFGGFARLSQPFTVQLRPDLSFHRLPSSHTCFNRLDLPVYRSYEELRDKLLLAIREGADSFGMS